MKIDSHQHFWKYHPVRDVWITEAMQVLKHDFLPEDLKPILEDNFIDGCIAVQADQSEEESLFLLELAEKNPFIKAVVGWVDLCAAHVEERLAFFSKYPKFKGVRHIVQAENDAFLLGQDFQNGISKLEPFGLVYEVLIRKEQLENAGKLVQKFPNQTFVLDHIAKPNIKEREMQPWKDQITALANHKNVSCKISGLVTEADWENHSYEDFVPYLDVVFEAFGVNRILFGSDWPVCLLADKYATVLSYIKTYISKFNTEEQVKIMGGNAIKIYALNN